MRDFRSYFENGPLGSPRIVLSVPVFLTISASVPGLGALSPWTLVIVPIALVVVTLVASAVPARRARQVDATVALRGE